jgi:hypothetical protein
VDRKLRTASLIAGALSLLGLLAWTTARLLERHDAVEAADELQRQAEVLGRTLESASEAAHLRAEALAALPVVRAAIETDVATVKDIERSNTVFQPAPGEAIELFQLGERRVSLLRAPELAHALALDQREVQLAEDGDALAVTASATVTPMYEAGHTGAIAVRRRVALDNIRHKLAERGLRVALGGLEAPVLLAGDPSARPVWTLAAAVPFGGLVMRGARGSGGAGALGVLGILSLALGLGVGITALTWKRRGPPLATTIAPTTTTSATPIVEAPRLQLAPAADDLESLPLLVPSLADAPPRDELSSDRLVAGKYRIIQALGAGNDAEVYLAQTVQQVGVPKVVALKLLRSTPELAADSFLEHMQHAARLTGSNIVRVHDFGIDEQRCFIAMEYVEGCSVACLLKELGLSRETMPLKRSLDIAIGVCRALEAAHGARVGGLPAPVLHRDLRPSSILIGRHGAVKLGDFGTLRTRLTAHTAPELARGLQPDACADLYSLGMVLNELVAGVHVPRSLAAVIAKATHATPRRRYASAERLRADLEDVSEAVAEPPSSGVLGDWVERVRRSHA